MPRPKRTRVPVAAASARLTPDVPGSLYALPAQDALNELIPRVLSVVAPHVDALEETTDDALAMLMGERLRRSLVRLEPLLDEALRELQALKEADLHSTAAVAHLRDTLGRAEKYLRTHGAMRAAPRHGPEARPMTVWSALKDAEILEGRLLRRPEPASEQLARKVSDALRQLMEARREEFRARMVLEDSHALLRRALECLAEVGRECERLFPEIASRVVPRVLEDDAPEQPHRFDVQ